MMFYDVLCFFGSLSKLVGLPMFANVCQVACIHVWNDAGLQWQAAQKPRGQGNIRLCDVLATESLRAKRLRFIQTFIRTFTTWVTLQFSVVKKREKSVYMSMYISMYLSIPKQQTESPKLPWMKQHRDEKTSKLQTLHCSPSKAGATNLTFRTSALLPKIWGVRTSVRKSSTKTFTQSLEAST